MMKRDFKTWPSLVWLGTFAAYQNLSNLSNFLSSSVFPWASLISEPALIWLWLLAILLLLLIDTTLLVSNPWLIFRTACSGSNRLIFLSGMTLDPMLSPDICRALVESFLSKGAWTREVVLSLWVFCLESFFTSKIFLTLQFGCGILMMAGPKKQDFWPKINVLKGNHCILRIQGAPVCQKLGMILENKVVQKLKLEKKFFFTKNGLLNWYS